jgi:hypothetical protein
LNLAKALAMVDGGTRLIGRVEHGLRVVDLASPLVLHCSNRNRHRWSDDIRPDRPYGASSIRSSAVG